MDYRPLYEQFKTDFAQIKRQYRLARITQFFIFGSAFVFWMLIFLPFVQTMLLTPENYILPSDFLQQQSFSTLVLSVFVVVSILIYGGSYIYSNVLPKLRAKEEQLSENLILKLFPKLKMARHLEVNGMALKQSQLFAWFNPYLKIATIATSAIHTFGILEQKKEDSHGSLFIADIGLVEDNVQQKSKSVLLKIPLINSLFMFYEFGLKRAFSKTLNDQMHYTFRGLFSCITFNKKLQGLTVVLPDNLEKSVGYLAQTVQSLNFKRDDIAYMEDPEFEKEFVVYTNNDIEARYILTASMMERMTLLKQKIKRPMMFSFTQNTLYIAIESPSGLFSWSPEDVRNEQVIEELQNDVQCCLEMFESLQIERKIWN